MNLENMCLMAARLADRGDELVKTAAEDGLATYRDEAQAMYAILKDGINEAYAEIADRSLLYDAVKAVTVEKGGVIDITVAVPNASSVIAVYDEDGVTPLSFAFITRFSLRVSGVESGDRVCVRVRLRPDPLENESDEPVFPESVVSPMAYAALAAARLFQSERKFSDAQNWMSEYRRMLYSVRPTGRTMRRTPRRRFR